MGGPPQVVRAGGPDQIPVFLTRPNCKTRILTRVESACMLACWWLPLLPLNEMLLCKPCVPPHLLRQGPHSQQFWGPARD